MNSLTPQVFKGISGTSYELNHDPNNLSQKISLFGYDEYYFIGTINDSASTQTS